MEKRPPDQALEGVTTHQRWDLCWREKLSC